jgi:hypothetical protein
LSVLVISEGRLNSTLFAIIGEKYSVVIFRMSVLSLTLTLAAGHWLDSVPVALADGNTCVDFVDRLVDQLHRVDPVTSFVVRSLTKIIIRSIQILERIYHVTLNVSGPWTRAFISASGENQRGTGQENGWGVTKGTGFHKTPRDTREECDRNLAAGKKFVLAVRESSSLGGGSGNTGETPMIPWLGDVRDPEAGRKVA